MADALTRRQREVLTALVEHDVWTRPLDVGGSNGSYHAAVLAQLVRKGLVERKKRHALWCYHGTTQRRVRVGGRWVVTDGHEPSTGCCCRGSCLYRATQDGRLQAAYDELDELLSRRHRGGGDASLDERVDAARARLDHLQEVECARLDKELDASSAIPLDELQDVLSRVKRQLRGGGR